MCAASPRTRPRAIVERLIGEAPSEKAVAAAVADALKGSVAMLMEAETWVALAFVVFVGLLGYLGVHRMMAKSLDDRAGAHQGRARRGAQAQGRSGASCWPNISASARPPKARRRTSSPAPKPKPSAGRRGQGQDRGFRRAPHQDGRNQDRTGRSAGRRRRPQRGRRSRHRRRGEDPQRRDQRASSRAI